MGTTGQGLEERGGNRQSPRFAIQDLYRKLNNIVRIGTVVDCDYQNNKVRVSIGGEGREQITTWITWGSRKSSYDRVDDLPELYEQVVILCMSGRLESAIIVTTLNKVKFPKASNDPNHRIDLMRVIEGTDYWFAKEERKFVGDVDPEGKRTARESQLKTNPPQDKLIEEPTATDPEGLEYYYRNIIRPELVALMEYGCVVTQPNGSASLKLVSNSMNSGTANFLLEAGVKGSGNAEGVINVLSGSATMDEPTNPNKPSEVNRQTGDAKHKEIVSVESGTGTATLDREVKNLGEGNVATTEVKTASNGDVSTSTVSQASGKATETHTLGASDGDAVKTLTINGSGKSELILNLVGVGHCRINVGSDGHYIDLDNQDHTINVPNNYKLICGANARVECDSANVVVANSADLSCGSVSVNSRGNATVNADGNLDLEGRQVSVKADYKVSIEGAAIEFKGAAIDFKRG